MKTEAQNMYDWRFGDSNLRELYWNLAPTDRLTFDCNTDTRLDTLQNMHDSSVAMDVAQVFLAQQIARHAAVSEATARSDSPVQQVYGGGAALVTGASGFLGKQLVEKLLRSCKIAKVYILLRSKKKKTFEERIQDLTRDPVYENLKKIQPNFWQKIVPVQGDVAEIGLGLSAQDRKSITEEINFIFHCAASVNFVESIKAATFTNVRGLRELIMLGKECRKLKSFVHVSTAYSHATYGRVGRDVREQFYRSPIAPQALIELAETLPEEQLDHITSQLITDWPNTYAFTKAVAEEAVRTMSGNLPICIVRPAIVVAALREPSPGWIDPSSAFGPTGILLGGGLGIIHVAMYKKEIALDLVPVDLVNNAVIAAAHQTAARRERGESDVRIYTLTGTRNPLKFGKLIAYMENDCRLMHSDKVVMFASLIGITNFYIYSILSFFLHTIPAFIIDTILRLMGKKPLLMKILDKINKLGGVLAYYMTQDWKFQDTNLRELYWTLSPPDRLIFDCNTDTIQWAEYLKIWTLGTRKYIIKDGLNRTAVGVKKDFYFRYLALVLFPLYLLTLYKLSYYFFFLVYCAFIMIINIF